MCCFVSRCTWDFDSDDNPDVITDEVRTPVDGTGANVTFNYTEPGVYVVNVTCANNITTNTTVINPFFAQDVITGELGWF